MYPIFKFPRLLGASLAAALLAATLWAADKPDTPPPPPPATPAAQPATAPAPADEKPAAAQPAAEAPKPAEQAAPPPEPKPEAPQPAQVAPAEEPAHEVAPKVEVTIGTEASKPKVVVDNGGKNMEFPIDDIVVEAGQTRREATAFMGNVRVVGEVEHDAVAIFGNNLVQGRVGHDAVAVFGSNIVNGKVGHDAVAVFSDLYINGEVDHDAVCVFGTMHLGPKAAVHGKTVAVMGRVLHDNKTLLSQFDIVNPMGGMPALGGAATWVRECLLQGRLLAFHPSLGFAWAFALSHLVLYLLIALLFRRGVERCVETFEERPGMSIVAFLLTLLLLPFVLILLAITGIGAIFDIALLVALFIAGRFGRAVMHAWLGRFVTRLLPPGPFQHVAFSVLVGGIMISLLYCVPFIGLLIHAILGFLGLGAVVLTLTQMMKRDRKPAAPAPQAPIAPPAPTPAAVQVAVMPSAVTPEPSVQAPAAVAVPPVTVELPPAPSLPPTPPLPPAPPVPPAAPLPPLAPVAPMQAADALALLAMPRATFWQRTGALLIDIVLVAVLCKLVGGLLPHFLRVDCGPGNFLVAMAAYGAIMWKLRGTTIGGIILKLQVVRTDGRPLDWSTCIVRGLGCLLSTIVVGLGFLWVAFDPEREAWHDKIAGTAVVRTPNHRSLV